MADLVAAIGAVAVADGAASYVRVLEAELCRSLSAEPVKALVNDF